jgi:hypothetical protein
MTMGLLSNGLFNNREPEEIRSHREVYAQGKHIGSTRSTGERRSKREAERILRDYETREEGGEVGRSFLGFRVR